MSSNNQNPVEQHTVPKVYLNRFSVDDNGNLFILPIKKPFKKVKTRFGNTSSVCYTPDFYTIKTNRISNTYGISDPYHIEKKAFDYENYFLEKELDKVSTNGLTSRINALKLIDAILNIKRRNVLFKNHFLDKDIANNAIENQIQIMNKKGEEYENEFIKEGIDIGKAIKDAAKILKSDFSNEDFLNDLFLEGFIENSNDKGQVQKLVKYLYSKKFFVFKTTEDCPFITSDNPGYTVIKGDHVVNIAFSKWETFSFPIDPTSLFTIIRGVEDNSVGAFKKIHYRNIDSEFVNLSNKATLVNSNEIILSNNEELLKSLNEEYHKYFVEEKYK